MRPNTYYSERKYLATVKNRDCIIFSTGDVILTGDYNAQTGDLPDYNVYDSSTYVPLPLEYEPDLSKVIRIIL